MMQPSVDAAPANWAERAAWFAEACAQAQRGNAAEVGDHAGALLAELEVVFCAGAWLTVIVLAGSVVEAQLREKLVPNSLWLPVDVLMEAADLPDAYDGLRRERNRILHEQSPPALSVETLWFEAEELEEAARKAVRLTARLIYGDPWAEKEVIDWP